ncbi:discoidin domain-containing protein [Marinimicrobium agarilyticum]|uniref:discoidin domain-containing protein n=1 Tax=Marinimicrobium agarilyticum TaxID=306546 RepID=UPI0004056A33|nr:discoidin domain-containing protein [Marinimicrobium agarilyticum]
MKKIVSAVLATSLLAPLSVLASASTNLALGKPVQASSIEKGLASLAPSYAVDGDAGSRWSSEFSDHQWISVDLEATYQLTGINLHWQNSYSKDYDIQVSVDGENWETVYSQIDSDGGLDQHALGAQARYVRIEGYRRATRWGHSLWELEVHGHPIVGPIALNKAANASSIEKGDPRFVADHAIDGDPNTRWSSEFSDHQWIAVDLGESHQITSLKLHWQNSYSTDYDIQTSDDGATWTTIDSVSDSDGGLDELSLSGHGRYLRVEGFSRATRWGHSLWELEAYGYASVSPGVGGGYTGGTGSGGDGSGSDDGDTSGTEPVVDAVAPTVPAGLTSQMQGPVSVALQWNVSSDNEGVLSYEVYRDGQMVAELLAPVTEYHDGNLLPATEYDYQVRASDAAGNRSALSDVISVSTVDASVISGAVRLEWTTPDQRENGHYLELSEIGGYEIRYQTGVDADPTTIMVEDPYATDYELMVSEGVYLFSIAVYDTNGLYSEFVPIQPL